MLLRLAQRLLALAAFGRVADGGDEGLGSAALVAGDSDAVREPAVLAVFALPAIFVQLCFANDCACTAANPQDGSDGGSSAIPERRTRPE